MAGDWIKMRTDLYRDPKVCVIADILMDPGSDLSAHVNQNCRRDMTVTRNVMRNVTVGALVTVWGVMRLRGRRDDDDLLVKYASIGVIDDLAELPGFGSAMESVGWVEATGDGIVFPRFFEEYNVDPKEDAKAKNAERQRRHRDKIKGTEHQDRNALRNVTVTSQSNDREEKSREEKSIEEESTIVDSCSEPKTPASEQNDDPPVLTFPAKGKGPKAWHLRQSKINEYTEAFPAVDILAECRRALIWCKDNPSKQKTANGMAAFLSNWLSRQQNNPRQNHQRPPSTPPTNDFDATAKPLTDEQNKYLKDLFERQRREHERKGLSADGPVPAA